MLLQTGSETTRTLPCGGVSFVVLAAPLYV